MDITQTNWFATPIWQVKTGLPLSGLKALVNSIREKDLEGAKVSNVGGWQSQAYPNVCSKYEKDYGIAKIMHPVIDLLNNIVGMTVSQQLGIPDDVKLNNFWFNVNHRGNYNNIHNHQYGIISGVLYIQIPNGDCGGITFKRKDDELQYYLPPHTPEKEYNILTSSQFTIQPKEGNLILFPSWLQHRVEPSHSDNARVSMSFNYGFDEFLGWGKGEKK